MWPSPKASGTQNGGFPEPYVRLFWGWFFPLHQPYPYGLYRWGFLHFGVPEMFGDANLNYQPTMYLHHVCKRPICRGPLAWYTYNLTYVWYIRCIYKYTYRRIYLYNSIYASNSNIESQTWARSNRARLVICFPDGESATSSPPTFFQKVVTLERKLWIDLFGSWISSLSRHFDMSLVFFLEFEVI